MDALFHMKLQMPVIKQKLASRARIDCALNEGLEGRLTLITAPAGYGKTTAASKWASQLQMPIAWYSIDSLDNSFKRFWTYFTAALESLIPGLRERFSQYLNTAGNMVASNIVAPLVDEIYQYKNQFVLILDDYHLIEEGSIHESMALLLKYLPENAHMVIIGRLQPPFSSVRLQTIGQIKEIGLSDLQFSTEEIDGLCKVKGVHASVREVTAIEALTEGWAAGLYLLLDSAGMAMGDLSKRLHGSCPERQRIDSYLSEEVIGQWGEEEKSFMLQTSILKELSGSLCNALTGRNDSREMLQRLAARNAFILILDREKGWYRYHHLFAEFLQKRLEENPEIKVEKLHERAGSWYESEGYGAEAIGHYLQGRFYDKAADLIEKKGREMLKKGVAETLAGWFALLPHDLVESREMLCLAYAWALIILHKESEAKTWLDKVEARICSAPVNGRDENRMRQLQVELVAARGFIELKNQDLNSTAHYAAKFQQIMQQGSIFLTYGVDLSMGGASLIGGIFGLKGRLRIAEEKFFTIYEKARDFLKTPNGYIPIMMGEILLERNRLEESAAMLAKGSREAEESKAVGGLVPLTIAYARLLKSKGDIKSAFSVVREGKEKLKGMGAMHLIPALSAFEARMNVEAGDQEAIDAWMARNCIDILDNPGLTNIYEYFTLARVLIAEKSYENCLLILNKIKLFAEKEKNCYYALEACILLAVAYYLQGHTHMAMVVLRQALQLGEMNGYERIFIEEGAPMAALLGRFVRSSFTKVPAEKTAEIMGFRDEPCNGSQDGSLEAPMISPVYVRRLLKLTRDYCMTVKVFKMEKAKAAASTAVKEISLTKREKDILHLLDSELTNAEIAYTLDISVNTVKVNCSSIYRKLEVKNRGQAVRIARELKLSSMPVHSTV